MSRPRRAAASRNLPPPPAPTTDPDADPDFLALSAKKRRTIDRAFQRGARSLGAKSRKRRKVDGGRAVDTSGDGEVGGGAGGLLDEGEARGFVDEGGAGGFMDVDEGVWGGGFMVDDDTGGGFIPDDDDAGGFLPDDTAGGFMLDDEDYEAGGFLPEPPSAPAPASFPRSKPSSTSPTPAPPPHTRIPLYILPGLLSSLGLPSDEDVLQVFRASASGWGEEDAPPPIRGKRGGAAAGAGAGEEDLGVELKDFRAVCAALMGPDDGGDEEDAGGGGGGGGEDESDDLEEEDTFEPSEDESDLSSASSYGGAPAARDRPRPGGKHTPVSTKDASATPRRTRGKGKLAIEGKAKLSANQRALAKDIWDMLKPPGQGGTGRGSEIMGRDEVKTWVRTLGEMWSDEEITDMVTLFSSQHEGRGLSFEDFGRVMLRAGLV